ncbi:MAG: P-type conjugative transfer ATPase TrbB [Nitrospirales bacterium]|nr:P-type conjugative transfer ATPase TrbB [Nitrospirales bacterium]
MNLVNGNGHTLSQERQYAMVMTALKDLTPHFENNQIVEVLVNPDGAVWVDEIGLGLRKTGAWMGAPEVERAIRLMATAQHAQVGLHNASLAATIPGYGFRIQGDLPPIVERPTLSIRKPASLVYSLQDYVEHAIVTEEHAALLRHSVLTKKNIIVSGGTGSGKTTLTNALLKVASSTTDRMVLIEDNRELQCDSDNKVGLLTNVDYPMRRAVMDTLRRRPDRIIIGEIRDGAALDLLKSWNTGHPGGISTIHANDPIGALHRLCTLIEEVVLHAPKELVGEAVDLVVHIQRDHAHPGGRRVTGIMHVDGYDTQQQTWIVHEGSSSRERYKPCEKEQI